MPTFSDHSLPIEYLASIIDYNPETGLCCWKVRKSQRSRPGLEIGYKTRQGYREVEIDGKTYSVHRIAWAIHHGTHANNEVDHKNGIRDDNRIENLRIADNYEQGRNAKLSKRNSTGFKGVYRAKQPGKFKAAIRHRGKLIYLGVYDDIEKAAVARRDMAKELFGEFYSDERNI